MTSQPHDPKHTEGASVSETRPNPNSHVTVRQDPDNPDNVIIRTRKRKRTGRRHSSHKHGMSRRTKIILIVVGIIVGILAAAGIALAIAVHMGNVNLHQVIAGLNNTPEEAKVQDEGQVVEYKGHTYRYNENVVAIALIGHDDESSFVSRPDASCADIDALIALDTATNKMRVIMVPRNSWVPVDVFNDDGTYAVTREMQLTLAHAMKLPTIADCAANTTKSISRVFYDLPITYYVDIDQQVVKTASTAVGGVPVEVIEEIPGTNYAVGDTVLLEGDEALRCAQYRNTPVFESALSRQDRQIQFIKSFMHEVSELDVPGILDVYNAVSADVTTNLGIPEITYLATCFLNGGNGDLEITTLTGTTELYTESNGIEYERYFLDKDSVMENTLAAFYTQID